MLLKIERTILRKATKKPMTNHLELTSFKKYSGEEIFNAMNSLKEKGYFASVDASIDYSYFSYELTTQGHFYKEFLLQSFLSNFLIPFVVALLTTIATLYLKKIVENDDTANHSCYTCNYAEQE